MLLHVIATLTRIHVNDPLLSSFSSYYLATIQYQRHNPDGFTIGINDGPAAGQTVHHAHIHIIPRYKGDVPDPRGGIRWVIPEKARYWDKAAS